MDTNNNCHHNVIFDGNEKETLKIYRYLYDQGVSPKIFLNDLIVMKIIPF